MEMNAQQMFALAVQLAAPTVATLKDVHGASTTREQQAIAHIGFCYRVVKEAWVSIPK